jgi:3-oxosteroid 1-dehydrogenase
VESYDVVVLGSGAAALTAAITAQSEGASVAIFEKNNKVGGTSAWSGGMIWIPCNHHMFEEGKTDSPEEAFTYLMSMSHGQMEERLIRAYIGTGPEMVKWLEGNTPVQFELVGHFPDYHPEHPGGKPAGGRSLECPLYSYKRELGEHADWVSVGEFYPETIATIGESPLGQPTPTTIEEEELDRRRAEDERGSGQSLVGRLFKAALDRDIPIFRNRRAVDLVSEDGRVTGVRFEDGTEVEARSGVVLATGGFEWNDELVRAFLRGPMTSPVSIKTNEGDGLKMAMRAGAALSNMREAWWMPAAVQPREGKPPMNILITSERTFPGSIMVNREGKRFTNEAANYNAFGAAFHEMDVAHFEYRNLPCWLIFDQQYLDRFGFGWTATPGGGAPDWIERADTLRELAEKLRIPPDALEQTVARWNEHAEQGRDPDFHRGESANDTWWGDPMNKSKPEATIGPLVRGPYYALEIKSGCLGTKGGPRIDDNARVLNHEGVPIPGLYAAGNAAGSPMAMTYGGAGGTLGPGMVFGFRAGRHAGRRAGAEAVRPKTGAEAVAAVGT